MAIYLWLQSTTAIAFRNTNISILIVAAFPTGHVRPSSESLTSSRSPLVQQPQGLTPWLLKASEASLEAVADFEQAAHSQVVKYSLKDYTQILALIRITWSGNEGKRKLDLTVIYNLLRSSPFDIAENIESQRSQQTKMTTTEYVLWHDWARLWHRVWGLAKDPA